MKNLIDLSRVPRFCYNLASAHSFATILKQPTKTLNRYEITCDDLSQTVECIDKSKRFRLDKRKEKIRSLNPCLSKQTPPKLKSLQIFCIASYAAS
jgi:hypothetical protein